MFKICQSGKISTNLVTLMREGGWAVGVSACAKFNLKQFCHFMAKLKSIWTSTLNGVFSTFDVVWKSWVRICRICSFFNLLTSPASLRAHSYKTQSAEESAGDLPTFLQKSCLCRNAYSAQWIRLRLQSFIS